MYHGQRQRPYFQEQELAAKALSWGKAEKMQRRAAKRVEDTRTLEGCCGSPLSPSQQCTRVPMHLVASFLGTLRVRAARRKQSACAPGASVDMPGTGWRRPGSLAIPSAAILRRGRIAPVIARCQRKVSCVIIRSRRGPWMSRRRRRCRAATSRIRRRSPLSPPLSPSESSECLIVMSAAMSGTVRPSTHSECGCMESAAEKQEACVRMCVGEARAGGLAGGTCEVFRDATEICGDVGAAAVQPSPALRCRSMQLAADKVRCSTMLDAPQARSVHKF